MPTGKNLNFRILDGYQVLRNEPGSRFQQLKFSGINFSKFPQVSTSFQEILEYWAQGWEKYLETYLYTYLVMT